MHTEYEPAKPHEATQDIAEPLKNLTDAAYTTAHGGKGNMLLSEAHHKANATYKPEGTVFDDQTAGECYFARELQELNDLPPNDKQGPRPEFRFQTGATYLGEWKGNMRHGMGKQTWVDGASFTGQWRDNYVSGVGEFQHADGDVFIGEWDNNTARGLGTYYHKGGVTIYSGEWVQDLQHGYGVERWDGGSKYSGQFVWGKKQGYGVYEWPDGCKFHGEWHANSISGLGHYVGRDGREFRGEWKNALIHGRGRYTWPDGKSFEGQYVDDKKQGFGIFRWRDGRRFEGWWSQGKMHGHGVTYRANGDLLKRGTWEMGNSEAHNNGMQGNEPMPMP